MEEGPLDPRLCQEFMKRSGITPMNQKFVNPFSKKEITKGGTAHNKIMMACKKQGVYIVPQAKAYFPILSPVKSKTPKKSPIKTPTISPDVSPRKSSSPKPKSPYQSLIKSSPSFRLYLSDEEEMVSPKKQVRTISFDPLKCSKFLEAAGKVDDGDSFVNPFTKKKVIKGKATYKKFLKICKQKSFVDLSSPKKQQEEIDIEELFASD